MSKGIRNIFIGIMAVLLLLCIGIPFYQNNEANKQLTNAGNEFSAHLDGNISPNRIDSTLIRLETQLSKLSKTYNLPENGQKIDVVLYPDVLDLQNNSNIPKWADAYISFNSGRPVIFLPAEQAPSDSSRKANTMASPRPGHELMHYIIRKTVGENNISQVPLWLNEGLAQYESMKGFNRILDRIGCKLDLWLVNSLNPQVLESDNLILFSQVYPNDHIDEFYIGSMEFVSYIESKYGSIKNILHDVSQGMQFSVAFQKEVGKPCEEVYTEWYKTFF